MSAVYKFLKAQALGVHVDEDPTAPIEFPPSLRLVSSDMTGALLRKVELEKNVFTCSRKYSPALRKA